MDKQSKIFVAGHRGLVGSAIVRVLNAKGYTNILTHTRRELDLENAEHVERFFQREKPEYVFLAAAKVGGILANNSYPAEFIYKNLLIQNNLIHTSHVAGVKKLCFLGSSCIYPKFAPQPMTEEYLLTGALEPTNEPYAVAKIAGIIMCQAYARQYGANFISVMPTNLYGPNDNFDLRNSHVLPALIRKFVDAKEHSLPSVVLWGSGTPRREFLYVDDMAEACVFLMQTYNDPSIVNIGTGEDVTILDLAHLIARKVGYKGVLEFDATKPDGTPKKLLDVSKLASIGWRARVPLETGIERTIAWYRQNVLVKG